METIKYYNDALAMGLCHVAAQSYSVATVRLDNIDIVMDGGFYTPELQAERDQLKAIVDLCFRMRTDVEHV